LPVEVERLNNFDRHQKDTINDIFALLGQNYQKVAYLFNSRPRLNELEVLVDKMGTAYDFYFISSQEVK